jgi:hypothetical protein
MYNNKEDIEEASWLMKEIQDKVIDKPKFLGCNDHFDFVYIPGMHGKICLLVPKRTPDPKELSELYRTLAEIAVQLQREVIHKTRNKLNPISS